MQSIQTGYIATHKGKRHYLAASWAPFGLGNRNCIGQSLALQEIRTVLAVFMAQFRFELPGNGHCSSSAEAGPN